MSAETTAQTLTLQASYTGYVLERGLSHCHLMVKDWSPLEALIQEIERALAAGFHRLAIASALTLPDVCAALQDPDHRTERVRYMAWYDENLASVFPYMNAGACYSMRCGVIHKGELGLAGVNFKRVIFTLPHVGGWTLHNCVADDALQFDAGRFCGDIIGAVREWTKAVKSNAYVQKNMDNVLRYRPHGLAPYIVGKPIIA